MTLPRGLVAGGAVLAGAAFFGWGYVVGRQGLRDEARASQREVAEARGQIARDRAVLAAEKAALAEPRTRAEATRAAIELRDRLNGLVARAGDELAAEHYDAAIALYDEALKLEPANGIAMMGRTGAVRR